MSTASDKPSQTIDSGHGGHSGTRGDADHTDPLFVVFPVSVWPYGAAADRAVWLLAQGTARALTNAVGGVVGFASPATLASSAPNIRLSLGTPPAERMAAEAQALGATWALSGQLRLEGGEVSTHLNVLSPSTGDLLLTRGQSTKPSQTLWSYLEVLKQVCGGLDLDQAALERQHVTPTGSWDGFIAFARAEDLWASPNARRDHAMAVCRFCAKAVSLDPGFKWAAQLLREAAFQVLAAARPSELRALRTLLQSRLKIPVFQWLRKRLK